MNPGAGIALGSGLIEFGEGLVSELVDDEVAHDLFDGRTPVCKFIIERTDEMPRGEKVTVGTSHVFVLREQVQNLATTPDGHIDAFSAVGIAGHLPDRIEAARLGLAARVDVGRDDPVIRPAANVV